MNVKTFRCSRGRCSLTGCNRKGHDESSAPIEMLQWLRTIFFCLRLSESVCTSCGKQRLFVDADTSDIAPNLGMTPRLSSHSWLGSILRQEVTWKCWTRQARKCCYIFGKKRRGWQIQQVDSHAKEWSPFRKSESAVFGAHALPLLSFFPHKFVAAASWAIKPR